MTKLQVAFFFGYLLIQVLVPLRRYLASWFHPRGRGDIMSDYRWYFCWTMRLRAAIGVTVFRIYDRTTGETLARMQASHFLIPQQAGFVSRSPKAVIQFAKFLERSLKAKGHKNFGIKVECHININGRGPKLMIDPEVDFTEEPIKIFGRHKWYWDDAPSDK